MSLSKSITAVLVISVLGAFSTGCALFQISLF